MWPAAGEERLGGDLEVTRVVTDFTCVTGEREVACADFKPWVCRDGAFPARTFPIPLPEHMGTEGS